MLACSRLLQRRGWSATRVAARIELSATTLLRWTGRRAQREAPRRRRGAKRKAPRPEHRRAALKDVLEKPRVGARVLRRRYPTLTRQEAERIKRRAHALRDQRSLALRWTRTGAVWAMDFTQPPQLVEGAYSRVLLVRDLASGMSLATVAMRRESATEVAFVLERLFREHGAPLVVKSDNGGSLVGGVIPQVLARWGITPLHSPPYTPRYNGACEAGVGSIKRGAELFAREAGRPGEWTLDGLEAARLYANEFGRPRSAGEGSPDDAWAARARVTRKERTEFQDALRTARLRETERNPAEEVQADSALRARIERTAVSAALAELNYLTYRRDRVTAEN